MPYPGREAIAADLKDTLIANMLVSIRAFDGRYVYEVRETSLMEDEYPELKTTIEEVDI